MFKRTRQDEPLRGWESFEAEAMPHMDDLFRVAKWLVRDHVEAEDIVQETFVQALQSFHRYEQGTNCRAWLMTILYRVRSKRIRAGSHLRLVNDADERIAETIAFDPPPPQTITEDGILQALAGLPPQFQDVVILSDVEDFTYKEIAETLNVPIGTVMSRLARGRKLLRGELNKYANAQGIGNANAGG
jgi:RNA polymerase sigma-70 factor (ECF subfamily)